ncbi:hypothetical protein SAMN05216317_1202 [Nitrosomonas eutropha]|nr:hypothetical protein [Nitrosomonas sp. GH22]SDW94894.1 hypothetical protein SAMN05216317_1202 [Nitrosomonas eutropha]
MLKADLAVIHDDNRSRNDYVLVLHTKKPKILPNYDTSGERCPRVKVNPIDENICASVLSDDSHILTTQYGSVQIQEL